MNQIILVQDGETITENKHEPIKNTKTIHHNIFARIVTVISIFMVIIFSCTIYAFVLDAPKTIENVAEADNTRANITDFLMMTEDDENQNKLVEEVTKTETKIETSKMITTMAEASNTISTINKINTTNGSNTGTKKKTSNGKSYTEIATLSIPSLNINYPILSSTSKKLLDISINKYWGANPNEVGNMCVVGHNYRGTSTKFFSKLAKIKKNAVIKITDLTGRTLDYKVYDTYVSDPYDTSCTSQLTNGHTEVTLITCYNKGTQRFIVKARAN